MGNFQSFLLNQKCSWLLFQRQVTRPASPQRGAPEVFPVSPGCRQKLCPRGNPMEAIAVDLDKAELGAESLFDRACFSVVN
jgi:hypothetical protein